MDATPQPPSGNRLNDERFLDQVKACYAEIEARLPALIAQHALPVVIGALRKEVCTGLIAGQMAHRCTTEEALALCERLKTSALSRP
jgi:hypothetical protein